MDAANPPISPHPPPEGPKPPWVPIYHPQPTHLVEFLVTVGTLVLLVGVVGLQVPHFGGGVGEGAPAVVALVGFLTAVDQLVPFEVARGGEELAAVVAAVFGLPRVPFLVEVQQADEAVALPTFLTAVGLQRAEEMKPSNQGKIITNHPKTSSIAPVKPVQIPQDGLKQHKREGWGRKIILLPDQPTVLMNFTRIWVFAAKSHFLQRNKATG